MAGQGKPILFIQFWLHWDCCWNWNRLIYIPSKETETLGQAPAQGLIGWNCVVPNHQRQGIGKAQILEMLRIFRRLGIQRACVTTMNDDFSIPEQRTYEACGFIKARKTEDNNIEYEIEL